MHIISKGPYGIQYRFTAKILHSIDMIITCFVCTICSILGDLISITNSSIVTATYLYEATWKYSSFTYIYLYICAIYTKILSNITQTLHFLLQLLLHQIQKKMYTMYTIQEDNCNVQNNLLQQIIRIQDINQVRALLDSNLVPAS